MVMSEKNLEQIILPALRGVMGNWVYYSSLMQLGELSSRISFVKDIHKHRGLSSMIQRALRSSRSREIADYIKTEPQRFFQFARRGGLWGRAELVRSK